MNTTKLNSRMSSNGFTLVEVLVATGIGSFVVAGVMILSMAFLWSYRDTTSLRNTSSSASLALERMVHGVGGNAGLLAAQASTVITVTQPSGSWLCSYNASPNLSFQWTPATRLITDQNGKTICSGVITSNVTPTSSAGVVNGCIISVTVCEDAGAHIATETNVMTTYVQFRNN
jgi:type II secretory pathway pseudopilin PulG